MPRIWVLADDRAGNRAQCLGVAERLGLPFDVKEIRYNAWVKLPNALRGASLIGVDRNSKAGLKSPWPDIIIAAGRRTAPIARYIKQHNPKAYLTQLMWPDAAQKDFDCIVLPSHDREHSNTPNVLRVLGAPHRITLATLEAAHRKWQPVFASLPSPRIAVLVGGSSKHGTFSTQDFGELGRLTAKLAASVNAGLLITTSRRTGKQGEEALMNPLSTIPVHVHSWQNPQGDNPYHGYLALADVIIVTGDSVAMCSEACASGKPVLIYVPDNLSAKHARFIDSLIAAGYAYPFSEEFTDALPHRLKDGILDSAMTVAQHIRQHALR